MSGAVLALTGHDIGSPAIVGSTLRAGDGCELRAGGADIWGRADEFHFACAEIGGDFDCRVRLESLEPTHLYTKAGIMARAGLEGGAPHFFHLAFPDNSPRNNNSGGIEAQYRLAPEGDSLAIYPPGRGAGAPEFPVAYPAAWLRLVRRGDAFEAFVGSDGRSWTSYARHRQELPARLFLGLALTSHDAQRPCRAVFRDFSLV